jgi:cyclin D7
MQLEEVLGHSFRPATVRDMEVTLLKALQWRLACVTPYSFLQLLLRHTTTAAATTAARRATRLLVRSLAEPSLLLRFDPSVVAASALRLCVNHQQQDHELHSDDIVRRLVRPHCCPTVNAQPFIKHILYVYIAVRTN